MSRGEFKAWDVDRASGEEAEELWRKTRTGIAIGTAEVKRDTGALKYGNAFFEYEAWSRRENKYLKSGLAVTEAATWVQVFWPIVLAVPTWMLREVCRPRGQRGDVRECVNSENPTKGIVVPLPELIPALVAKAKEPVTGERAA